jgi:hypothetical protein
MLVYIWLIGGVLLMEELLRLCGTYGFPMVIAIYLLVRLEPLIRQLGDSIVCLTIVVAKQSGMSSVELLEMRERYIGNKGGIVGK